MNNIKKPAAKDLVFVGGGHSHAIALRMLGMEPISGARVTLVSDVTNAPYSGMLPGYLSGHYSYDEVHIDLRKLCSFANVRFIHAKVEGIDLDKKIVLVGKRPPIEFDFLSINTGSTPVMKDIPGADKYAIPAKPVPQLLHRWNIIREVAKKGTVITVVGGGVAGVELALCIRARLGPDIEIHIIHNQSRILNTHNERVSAILLEELSRKNIAVHLNEEVSLVKEREVICTSGTNIKTDYTIWVTQASAAAWLKETQLATNSQGFIRVHSTLESISHPFVFACGDVATIEGQERPKAGVFAVRQGKPLFLNLRRTLEGKRLLSFTPQKHFLSLVGTGEKVAVLSRDSWAWKSAALWTLKEYIDRKFMRRFEDLPFVDTSSTEISGSSVVHKTISEEILELETKSKMRCVGCAAKVGGTILSKSIARIRNEFQFSDDSQLNSGAVIGGVVIGLNEPDDAAVIKIPENHLLVQTVDYFPALVSDPYIFGRIAVQHCFSDIFAMGATAQSALCVVLVPFSSEKLMEDTIYQLLYAVTEELSRVGALLAGGHTAEGSDVALGLVCNGIAKPNQLLKKGGIRAGDQLILTKALGTGTLFAADMRLKAKGIWIDEAISSMLLSNQESAKIFFAHEAEACTDITGFGLLGHLTEMTSSSGQTVKLHLDELPILSGAQEASVNGVRSSLYSQNELAKKSVINHTEFAKHVRFPLLFDPQTSGGLLASVAEDRAQQCLEALLEAGYSSSRIIGKVVDTQGGAKGLVELEA